MIIYYLIIHLYQVFITYFHLTLFQLHPDSSCRCCAFFLLAHGSFSTGQSDSLEMEEVLALDASNFPHFCCSSLSLSCSYSSLWDRGLMCWCTLAPGPDGFFHHLFLCLLSLSLSGSFSLQSTCGEKGKQTRAALTPDHESSSRKRQRG